MSHSIDETYDVYSERIRRAAKDHVCDACKETIRKGDRYCRVFIMWEGEPQSHVRCLRCDAMHEYLRTLSPGEMWPAERLDCGEEFEEHWGKEPPPEVAALAFMTREEMQARAAPKGAA